MNDIYPIQEWVETNAGIHADLFAEGIQGRLSINDLVFDLIQRPAFDHLSSQEKLILADALRWKIHERLASWHQNTAEGWCESYYRALKRKYEGDY